jgi:hypothetical protein
MSQVDFVNVFEVVLLHFTLCPNLKVLLNDKAATLMMLNLSCMKGDFSYVYDFYVHYRQEHVRTSDV